MRSYHGNALTLLETIAILVIIAIGILLCASIFLPSLRRGPRFHSSRLVCSSNVKHLGTSLKIYANFNGGMWPGLPVDEKASIDYRVPVGGGAGTTQSPNRSQPSISGSQGTRQISVSRVPWMLVRSGDVTVK